jgi:hypothetical protein
MSRESVSAKTLRSLTDSGSLYYGGQTDNLQNCTAPIHALLHVVPIIDMQGPPCYYWCFSVERFGGWMKKNLHNRKDILKSLSNAVIKQEEVRVSPLTSCP